jgi:hypothetical protein
VAVVFLTDAQVAAYGRFGGVPSRADLERFFMIDDADKTLIGDRRGDHNRLGFMLQATTVRYLGAFLEDPLDVPGGIYVVGVGPAPQDLHSLLNVPAPGQQVGQPPGGIPVSGAPRARRICTAWSTSPLTAQRWRCGVRTGIRS